jgi:hypothetical protein
MTLFSVFSQVDNLGCIEFLNRESQVRFLPGALPEVPGQRTFSARLKIASTIAHNSTYLGSE